MPFPKNPDTIIVKNQFYPSGLKEIDIWNYYQKHKDSLIEQAKEGGGRVAFTVMLDTGPIFTRYGEGGKHYILTRDTFDKIITGRTLTIHGIMRNTENRVVIDIDTPRMNDGKDLVFDLYPILESQPFIKDIEIRFTGKRSFHIFCHTTIKKPIGAWRITLEKLITSKLEYLKSNISFRRGSSMHYIDLYRNQPNGAFILRDSLNKTGLRCMKVELGKLHNFHKELAIVKK